MKGISTMQVHGKGTIAVICELINVDVKLNGYGKTRKHCWFAKYFTCWKYYTRISYLPQVNWQDWILIKHTTNVRKPDRLSLVICKMPNRTLYSVFSFFLHFIPPTLQHVFCYLRATEDPLTLKTVFTELKSAWRCVETGFPLESVNAPLSPSTILTA